MLVVAATLALGTLAGFVTTSAYESRYAATVVPLMLLAVAAGFLVTPRRWPVFVLFALWAALALGRDRSQRLRAPLPSRRAGREH